MTRGSLSDLKLRVAIYMGVRIECVLLEEGDFSTAVVVRIGWTYFVPFVAWHQRRRLAWAIDKLAIIGVGYSGKVIP